MLFKVSVGRFRLITDDLEVAIEVAALFALLTELESLRNGVTY